VLAVLGYLLIALVAFALPGWLLARALRPDDLGLERLLVAATAGPMVVGWLLVAIGIGTDTHMSRTHLVGIALVLSAALTAWKWADLRGARPRVSLSRADVIAVGLALVVGLLFLVHYDRDLFQFNCINRAASLVLGATRAPDWATGTYILDGNHNVRLGNVCFVAPAFVAFDFPGPRILYAWIGALLFGWGVLLGRRVLSNPAAPLALGALLALNPYVLAIPIIDENLLACLLVTVLLAELAAKHRSAVWLGLVFGYLVGVRHITLLLAPGLLWAFHRGRPTRRRWLALVGATAAVGLLWAVHHQRVFGSPFVFESFEEYHRDFPHSFLGLEFGFRGLLNAPFNDRLVRTPYNAYPVFALMVLWVLNRFGLLLSALAPLGAWRLRDARPSTWVLVAAVTPLLAMLGVLENAMQPNKLGMILAVVPCLALAIVAGGEAVAAGGKRLVIAWAVSVAVLAGIQLGLSKWDVPADARVYSLEDAVRVERPEYLEWERTHLVRHNLLPDMRRVAEYSPFEPARKLRDLVSDLTASTDITPNPRVLQPPLDANANPVLITLDLSKPLVGRDDWVSLAARRPDFRLSPVAGRRKMTFALPQPMWSDLPARIAVAADPPAGTVQLVLEFGAPALFEDLLPETETTAGAPLAETSFTVAVPPRTRIIVTEVVADHFSRYYRWWITADPEKTRLSTEPTVVFTN